MNGQATYREDLSLVMNRKGFDEQTWFTFSYSPVRDESGKVAGMFCAVSETTSKVLAERALRTSEGRLRALVSASSYAIYRMNADWTEMLEMEGQGFIADTQSPSEKWLGQYIHPDDQPEVTAAIQKAIDKKSIFELEHRVRRLDGSWGWTLSHAVPISDSGGAVIEWFGAASDVTDRKRAEEELRNLNATLEQRVAEEVAQRTMAQEALRQAQKRRRSVSSLAVSHTTSTISLLSFRAVYSFWSEIRTTNAGALYSTRCGIPSKGASASRASCFPFLASEPLVLKL